MNRSHKIVLLLVTLAVGVIVLDLFSDDDMVAAQANPNAAKTSAIRVADCRVKLIDQVILSSDQIGILAGIVPREGQKVVKNQLLDQIDDGVARATYDIVAKQAENDVEVRYARKSGELAQVKYLRAIETNRDVPETIPELELRELRLAAEKAMLQFEQAQSNLVIAKLKRTEASETLHKYRIVAPFDGVVHQVFKQRGESIGQADPILEVVNTNRIKVEGHIGIEHVSHLRVGNEVRIQVDLPNLQLEVEKYEFVGRLEFVDVRIEPVSRKVRIWAEVDNRNGFLMDGYAATMVIQPNDSPKSSR